MATNQIGKITALAIASIRTDGGTQMRVSIDQDVVADYREQMENGTAFPPIVVYHDGTAHWLADGFHRFSAAKNADCAKIDAEVRSGTQRDAILFAIGANGTHGLTRSIADKRRAVAAMLTDGEWSKWSDRKIAEAVSVSHTFVASLRRPKSGNFASEKPTASVATLPVEADEVATLPLKTPITPNPDDIEDEEPPPQKPSAPKGEPVNPWDEYNAGLTAAAAAVESCAKQVMEVGQFDKGGQAGVPFADGILIHSETVGVLRHVKRALAECRIAEKRGNRYVSEREKHLSSSVAAQRKVGV